MWSDFGCIVATLLVAALSAPPLRSEVGQKPVRETTFHIDGGPARPESLDDLWKQASVVVEGRIAREFAHDDVIVAGTPGRSVPFTVHEIELTEVFKRDNGLAPAATSILVKRKGGVRDRGDYIQNSVEEGFPSFRIGDRYILFLQPMPGGVYAVAGAIGEGAILVRGEELHPRGNSAVAEQIRQNPALFRLSLRNMAQR